MSQRQFPGVFFDGESALDRQVIVHQADGALNFSGPQTAAQKWSLGGLHAIDPPTAGQPFRLSHDNAIGARLIVRDQALIDELLAAAPHLRGHYGLKHFKQVAAWTLGGLAVVAGLGWFTLNFLPQHVAGLIPDSWRNRTGIQIEKSVANDAKVCEAPAGKSAMGKLVAAIAEGDPALPPVVVTVYDLPILNAFAVSGGRVIMTRELIQAADHAGEVVGVLAHEIGHVKHLHPEEQLVRVTGLQLLISLITGSNGGDLVTNVAGFAAILRYSREAEVEADQYARDTLLAAKIDPTGFRSFFEKMLKFTKPKAPEVADDKSTLDRIGDVFSTHPDTEDRIKKIEPLPSGISPVELLTKQEWEDLRRICG